MSYRCGDSWDSFERHKVKVAHAQRPWCEGERSRFDVGMGVHSAVHVDRRTTHTRIARRNGKIFGVSRTPSETVSALRERGTTERRLTALQLGQVPQREARSVHRADTTQPIGQGGCLWGIDDVHVWIGVLPCDRGGERTRRTRGGAWRGELEDPWVVPCVCGCM